MELAFARAAPRPKLLLRRAVVSAPDGHGRHLLELPCAARLDGVVLARAAPWSELLLPHAQPEPARTRESMPRLRHAVASAASQSPRRRTHVTGVGAQVARVVS
jgi:hypothetical protein